MAHLGGEAGITGDAILKGLGHLVAGIGNEVEVISLVSSRDMNLLHTIDKVKYIFFSRITQ
jgi:hypothetical protein